MKREYEKTDTRFHPEAGSGRGNAFLPGAGLGAGLGPGALADRVSAVLAPASVVATMLAAVLAAAGASWSVRAYFSIVDALFDIFFSYLFFVDVQRSGLRLRWQDGLSSVVPLVFVSGPFLSGWLLGDLGAASVRGFWLGASPASALGLMSVFRLLRVTRPLATIYGRQSDSPRILSSLRIAAGFGILVALTGAFASEAFLLPGYAKMARDRRASVLSAPGEASGDSGRAASVGSAGVLALRVDGRAVIAAAPGISPADYAYASSDGVEAWFSVIPETRARATLVALSALASLAAAGAYAVALRSQGNAQRSASPVAGSSPPCPAPKSRPRAMPAGKEELAGILGKRSP